MHNRLLPMGGTILVVLACATAIAAAQATAAGGGTTLRFLDLTARSTPAFDAGTGEPRPGDRVFLTDTLYTWHGSQRGLRAGSTSATLTFMSSFGKSGATADLSGQFFLRGGSIRAEGVIRIVPGRNHFVLPIVGGTGTYAGAHGTVESTDLGRSGDRSTVVVRLIG